MGLGLNLVDRSSIRSQSIDLAAELGLSVLSTLPLLEQGLTLRSKKEIVDRLLQMHAAAARAYEFPRKGAKDWLLRERIWESALATEQEFIDGSIGSAEIFQSQMEGMWALAWSLGHIDELDFGGPCADDFVLLLPDLKVGESAAVFREKSALRSADEILGMLDLAYCCHWAVRHLRLEGNALPPNVLPEVIEERRRALEWCHSTEPWDRVPLDT